MWVPSLCIVCSVVWCMCAPDHLHTMAPVSSHDTMQRSTLCRLPRRLGEARNRIFESTPRQSMMLHLCPERLRFKSIVHLLQSADVWVEAASHGSLMFKWRNAKCDQSCTKYSWQEFHYLHLHWTQILDIDKTNLITHCKTVDNLSSREVSHTIVRAAVGTMPLQLQHNNPHLFT